MESVASDHGGSEKSTEQGMASKINEPKEDRSVPLSHETANNINQIRCLGKIASTYVYETHTLNRIS
ncbi:hypothetical protein N7507_004373 [Penicillium longicatenatum]|nr:hypothetical protein N7507_004373 [Penicillium longicatenatum]